MAAPTAANVAPPNNNPLNVTPVAIIASNGTTSFLSFCVMFFLFLVFIVQRYAIILYVQIIWIIFSSNFLGANIPIYISAAPVNFTLLLPKL